MEVRDKYIADGVPDRFIVDRTTHPQNRASSWAASGKGDILASGVVADYRLPHINSESVLIAAIGNLYEENCWWRLQNMMRHTVRNGYNVSLHEVDDGNFFSSDAIWMMRWSAAMMARDAGIQWVLMVDGDALLEEDTLLRLMAWDRPVVYPLLVDLEQKYPKEMAPLSSPANLEPDKGLVPVKWSAMSVMLFDTKVFNALDSAAFRGNDFIFAQAVNYIGHRIYVDTNTVVSVVKGPARVAAQTYDEQWATHRAFHNRLQNEDRDRRPPPDFDPVFDDGIVDKYGAYFAVNNASRNGENDTA